MTSLSSTHHTPPPVNNIPMLTGGLPLIGHLTEFLKDPVTMLIRGWHEQGELFQFRLGTRKFVLFAGPEAHDCYFRAPRDHLSAKDVYQFTVPIFGRGVAYDVSPELMSEQLGFLYPELRESALRKFSDIMFEETMKFADAMGQQGELDLPQAMNQLTINIASHCLIGPEVRNQLNAGFAESYHDLQNGINTLGFFFPHLPTPAHRSRDRARKSISELFKRIVMERRRTGARPDDFMQKVMESRYKDGRAVTDEEITGILLTVLFAGQHTSAVLATWTCLELLNSPSYIDKLRNEMQEVYANENASNIDTLKQQSLMEYTIRENERLHPPLILLIRKVLKPVQFGNHSVPAGSLAMVSPAAAHRLPHLFADPDRFYPERFASPNREDKQHRYTLIGFGGGKHMCMGKHFAYLQLKTIWTVLLDRFDFFTDRDIPAPNYGSWVTGPKEPCRVHYQHRSKPGVFH